MQLEDREGGGKGAKGKERGEGAAGEDQGLDRAAASHSQREASQSTLHFGQIILAALHGQVGRYIRGTRWGSKGEAVPGITVAMTAARSRDMTIPVPRLFLLAARRALPSSGKPGPAPAPPHSHVGGVRTIRESPPSLTGILVRS